MSVLDDHISQTIIDTQPVDGLRAFRYCWSGNGHLSSLLIKYIVTILNCFLEQFFFDISIITIYNFTKFDN